MALIVLIMGVLIVAAAIRDTHRQLFGALATDVPAFMVWAAAIFAVGAIGWIPGLSPVSRGLLALVLVALVLQNYRAIIEGLSMDLGEAALGAASGVGSPTPVSDRVTNIGEQTGAFGGVSYSDIANMIGEMYE